MVARVSTALLLLFSLATTGWPQVLSSGFDLASQSDWEAVATPHAMATFGYPYESELGLPPSGQGDGVGLRLAATMQTPLGFAEVAVVPSDFVAPPTYRMTVDVYAQASSSTEFFGMFAGHDGIVPGRDGFGLLVSNDGRALRDYRLYIDQQEQFFDGPSDVSYDMGIVNGSSPCEPMSTPTDCRAHEDDFWANAIGDSGAGGKWLNLGIEVGSHAAHVEISVPGSPAILVGSFTHGGQLGSGVPALVVSDLFLGDGPGSSAFVVFENFVLEATSGPGDFDGDGDYDCADINRLTRETASGANRMEFDLTGDGRVDRHDIDAWLVEAGANSVDVTGGAPFVLGDADLDGHVNGLDFVEWNDNKFQPISDWCSGDFNGDGFVNGPDFVIWNDHKFGIGPPAVPEPVSTLWSMLVLLLYRAGDARPRVFKSADGR